MKSFFFVSSLLLTLSVMECAHAQPSTGDVVDGLSDWITLQQDNGSRIRVRCTILDYNGLTLTYRTRVNGPIKTLPIDEVVGLQTARVAAHRQAAELLERRQFAEAQKQLDQALQDEPRNWVRRDILALSVQAALAQGNYLQAGSRFLLLYESDPDTPRVDLFPLLWNLKAPDETLVNEALRWQSLNKPAAKLLSASVLLTSALHQRAAVADLRALSVNADRRVQRLAQAQLWRLELLNDTESDSGIANWEFSLELLPEELRGGPHFVIAMGHRRRLRYAAAAEHFLWTGLIQNSNGDLAATALVDAAVCLQETGRPEGADTLLREVAAQYPDSRAARQAAELLKSSPK